MSLRTRPQSRAGDPNASSSLTSRKSNSLDLRPTLTDPPTYVVNLDLPPRSRWNVRPSVTQESEAYSMTLRMLRLPPGTTFSDLDTFLVMLSTRLGRHMPPLQKPSFRYSYGVFIRGKRPKK